MIRMGPQPDTGEVLAGLVERVTYHNAENGFCVLRASARGHRDAVTVVGIMASGQWVNDRTHGQQFKARFLRTSAPTSVEGIERYDVEDLLAECAHELLGVDGSHAADHAGRED